MDRVIGSYSRREVLRMGAVLAAGFGLSRSVGRAFANGLEQLFRKQQRVFWVQGLSCSGCSVSLLNSDEPGALQVVTDLVSMVFHSTLSAAQGDQVAELIEKVTQEGGYILVCEGAVPAGMPEACHFAGHHFNDTLQRLITKAQLVVAAGSCASFGGLPGSEGNATGAVGLGEFMQKQGLVTEHKLINCPGCPTHPESLVGTLAYAAAKGYPDVDPKLLTPKMFYSHSVHDDCPRFHQWEKDVFAEKFGDEGCLFKLGCLGPLSRANCSRRQWNGGVNWCIRAGAPCIGCTSHHFGKQRSFAFYRKGEKHHLVSYSEADRKGEQS